MKKIQRKKIADEVADALRAEIEGGRWSRILPGYRTLQEFIGVGRRAIQDALANLTEEGLLATPEPGKSRVIVGGPQAERAGGSSTPKRIRVVLDKPGEYCGHEMTEILGQLQKALGPEWDFEKVFTKSYFSSSPEYELDRLVELNPSSLWIFCSPLIEVVNWIEKKGIEAICLGGETRLASVAALIVGWTEVSREMFKLLNGMGHNKISFLCTPTGAENREKYLEVLQEDFLRNGVQYTEQYNFPMIASVKPEDARRCVADLLRHTPPTAVVCTGVDHYLALVSCCAERGIQIGKDMAAVLVGEDEYLPWLSPKPTFLRAPIKTFAEKLYQWALNPSSFEKKTYNFSCEICEGETLVPPL